MELQLLIVDDSENDARLIVAELAGGGWSIKHRRVETRTQLRDALAAKAWDVVIADYSMPQFSGAEALTIVREVATDVPLILISGHMGEATAVAAMKAGANDYLFKGDLHRLVPAVERELRESVARRQAREIQKQLHRREGQLAEALRLARLGTWHIDFANDVATWSEEGCRILGFPQAPTLTEFLQCIHVVDRGLLTDALATPAVTRIAFDCRINGADTPTFVHIRGDINRGAGGAPIEARGMIQDIVSGKPSMRRFTALRTPPRRRIAPRASSSRT